jgi:putative endonuclease
MYSVYVLYSLKDDKLYIGFSSKLVSRINDHLNGFSKSTRHRRPLVLIFCEYYLSKKDAMRREKYFKTTDGKRTLRLMLKESLKEVRYKK